MDSKAEEEERKKARHGEKETEEREQVIKRHLGWGR